MLGFLSLVQELAQGILQLLYPTVCCFCNESLPAGRGNVCAACRQKLTTDPHAACPRCAATVGPFALTDNGCTACRALVFHFERVSRLGPYEGFLREVILRMKHSTGEWQAETLGDLWAEHSEAALRLLGAQIVVPVPLHWWRRWTRGYNQSEALARRLARRLGLPCRPGWLRRNRNTPRQVLQTAAGRRDNVRGAFTAARRPELRGKTILLVDDVLTTGTTASEAARALLAAGAQRVVAAVLAVS
jgi:ComF family protein